MNKSFAVGIALAAVALLMVPSAVAQTPPKLDVAVSPPTGEVIPERTVPMSMDITWSQNNPAQPLAGAQNNNVQITITPNCPFNIQITGQRTLLIPIDSTQPQGPHTQRASLFVTVPRTAPGLQTATCNFEVTGTELAPTGVPAPDSYSGSFPLNVGYYSLNQVQVATKLKQAGPQKQVPFELEITNFGNARTQYLFEITNAPGGKWNALPPEVMLLDSPNAGTGSPTNTAVFTVATPFKNGWNNDEGAYTITISPSAADDPEKVGNPLTANILVRVRGVYVPGLEPFVMVAAILGTALVLRLRKDE